MPNKKKTSPAAPETLEVSAEARELLKGLVTEHSQLLDRRVELEAELLALNARLRECERRSATAHAVLVEDAA